MWINRNTTPFTKITRATPFTEPNGTQHGAGIFTRWTEEKLNAIKLFTVVEADRNDSRYYKNDIIEDFEATPPTMSYSGEALPLADVQSKMIKDLFAHVDKIESSFEVDSTLGYNVRGSHNDLRSFEVGNKRGFTPGRDINGIERSLSPSDYTTIITAIEDKGKEIFDTKWTKFDEIMGKIPLSDSSTITTVSDCILYEATPYDYTITAEDVANDPTLVLDEAVVRHTNNCTNW